MTFPERHPATICFVARNDFESKPGGDTVKWLSYQAAAREAGFQTSQWFDDSPLPAADLYHCINLDRPYDLYPKMQAAHRCARPFVISSIHRPNAWLETFRRHHPPHGWAGRVLYRSPLGNRVGRSETLKDAIRLLQQGRLRRWKDIFPGWTRRARWLIQHAEKVLLLSRREADAFGEDFGAPLPPPQSSLVPNWISAFGDASSPVPSEFMDFAEPPVLVVGRIEAAKNSCRIARLAARLGRGVVFIGKVNPYEKDYAARFGRLIEGASCLRWIQGVERARLPGYYRHAAFLLDASYFEGCPWVDMEALYFGCPLVTTRYALHHEFLPPCVPQCDPYSDDDLLRFLQTRPEKRPGCQPIDPAACKTELLAIYRESMRPLRSPQLVLDHGCSLPTRPSFPSS